MLRVRLHRILALSCLLLLMMLFQNCTPFQGNPIGQNSQSNSCAASSAKVTAGTTAYQNKCATCHSVITSSSIANKTAAQIQTALGSVPQMNGLAATLSTDDVSAIAEALSISPTSPQQCNASLKTSNFTRSSSEVMQIRAKILFPNADLSSMLDPNQPLGQSLGMPDFLTSFSVIQPDSASAQASFQKYVASKYCKTASSDSSIFSTSDILMAGETLPADPDEAMAFKAARNVWLAPYLVSSNEVQILVTLIRNMKTNGAATAEVQQAVCLAALSAPQFWKGNPGKFEAMKRIALDIGRRRPTFTELSNYNSGSLTLANYIQKIQSEPNYIETVKTWHRNWFGPVDYTHAVNERRRGFKYIWGYNGATYVSGQEYIPQDSSGSLDATIPIIRQVSQNNNEVSDSTSCQPFPQTFDPVTQRIQWEHRINGQWYVVGGWKLVSGTWQTFGGSVPVNGSNVTTAVTDVVAAPAVTAKVSFHYTSGAMAGLPVFAASDRRVRRFTVPDDVNPNSPSPATEQNGYSLVNMWWSGKPVYVCNAFHRFLETCAWRPASKGYMDRSTTWNGNTPQIVFNMGGDTYIGVDSVANPTVIAGFQCAATGTSSGLSFSNTGTLNSTIVNAEVRFGGDGVISIPANWQSKYPSLVQEQNAVVSILQDIENEPMALVADIVGKGMDYRTLLTADWTNGRGPLELMYRIQGQYLAVYPPGLNRIPGVASDYMTSEKIYPMNFSRLAKNYFTNSLGGQMANDPAHVFDDSAGAVSVIDDPNLQNLAPRPISGVLTQAAFLGSAVPKMRSISAKILRTFTCGEVNTYVPTSAELTMQTKYIPISEKSGAQHVDPKGTCIGCHINMDPLASALSLGFRLKVNPFTNKPINNGSEWLYGFGELAPYAPDESGVGYRYGVRGNLDLPSPGALFGHEISGVRDVGKVLSQSDLFAQCAVIQAFTSVFGRPPSFPEDQALIDSVKQGWIGAGYNYNKLIELLVVSAQFQVRN